MIQIPATVDALMETQKDIVLKTAILNDALRVVMNRLVTLVSKNEESTSLLFGRVMLL